MSDMDNDQQKVTYTVKELLNRIDGKLDNMALAMAQKAEAIVVERLTGRVEALEATDRSNKEVGGLYLKEWEQLKSDVKTLKEHDTGEKQVSKYKRWLIATGLTLIATATALGFTLHQLIH